ncbi:hypothetical protein [Aquipuribacter sp. MA13-6]|uniref:hypothetical protein n=1 Tax=unclassified Aquipuribacter TaxID=2635084 RepID=UPI003EE954FE
MLLAGVVVCLLLVGAVLLGSRGPGPLDQPDAASQRDGLVLDGPRVDPLVAGVHLRDVPNVLLFVRAPPDADLLDSWRHSIPAAAQVTVVVQGHPRATAEQDGDATTRPPAGGRPGLVSVVEDPDELLAAAVRLPEPVDGGPGIGYAVVDPAGVVRYSTLDPSWPDNAFEVTTILGSAP